ncbi:hypothetical protein SASPL_143851 [Salvia splendens]|uniref:Uncharacterized protein n=1 Tax=Salvia splendens TaxID=180675 RepID=A0A8X8WPM8_SALSN|nr:hypothetical protein SASPL_143851 [Salvia splendens]
MAGGDRCRRWQTFPAEAREKGDLREEAWGKGGASERESSIISNILSLDFDSWDKFVTSPQNLAKLLGETDRRQGSYGALVSRSQVSVSPIVEQMLSNNIFPFSQLNLHQSRNGITSNRQCDGWNETRSVNNFVMAELLRTERLGHSSKFYSGYEECNTRLPGWWTIKSSRMESRKQTESGEASDWTANWNGDDAPLAGGRKQSRNSKPAKATFGELFKYKSKARLEEKIVRSVTKDAQGVLSQKSGEIHEVGNHSSAKVRVCEDMIMKPMVEMQDMQEVGRPPDRGNDVLTMTSVFFKGSLKDALFAMKSWKELDIDGF